MAWHGMAWFGMVCFSSMPPSFLAVSMWLMPSVHPQLLQIRWGTTDHTPQLVTGFGALLFGVFCLVKVQRRATGRSAVLLGPSGCSSNGRVVNPHGGLLVAQAQAEGDVRSDSAETGMSVFDRICCSTCKEWGHLGIGVGWHKALSTTQKVYAMRNAATAIPVGNGSALEQASCRQQKCNMYCTP